jgi:hypothetical protein
MGALVTKFKLFREESFTTTIPILTPRVAGAGMMVSPKTLVAAIIGKLTGEPEHEAGCKCDLCKYREVKKQAQCEVADQRLKISSFVDKYTPFNKHDNDELTDDEVMYYYSWLVENFPEIVYRYEDREGSLYLADRIASSHKSKIDIMLLQILIDNHKLTFLSKDEIDTIIDENQIGNNGLIDSWAVMFQIAELRKEREVEGFEAAIGLDIP